MVKKWEAVSKVNRRVTAQKKSGVCNLILLPPKKFLPSVKKIPKKIIECETLNLRKNNKITFKITSNNSISFKPPKGIRVRLGMPMYSL